MNYHLLPRERIQNKALEKCYLDEGFIDAAAKNYISIVKLLLEDKRADPSVAENTAIRSAAENTNVKILKLLMADLRVDPSACENSALKRALSNVRFNKGKVKKVEVLIGDDVLVVQMLLQDKRVRSLWESRKSRKAKRRG